MAFNARIIAHVNIMSTPLLDIYNISSIMHGNCDNVFQMKSVKSEINHIMGRIWERKLPFLLMFFAVVTLTYAVLFAIDFIPEPVTVEAEAAEILDDGDDTSMEKDNLPAQAGEATTLHEPVAAFPVRIFFDTLDKEVPVLNPESREIVDLDRALLSGAVRHPDSANFEDTGNIFILAHSSYLPNVFNKNFQAFNGIQKLKWGDVIRVQSEDKEYVYKVDRVYEAKASSIVVPNSRGVAKLTLSTCNSFGSKDDRFMVEAALVSSTDLN